MALTTRTKIAGAVLGAALAAAAALVPLSDTTQDNRAGQRTDVILADSKDAIPSITATDWVSYGDQVAVVHVAAENEIAADSEELAAGEGYLSRTVTLQVKDRVWSRAGTPALPDNLSVIADGWSFKGDTKTRVGSHEAPRLEVGHDYVVALAHFSDGEWSPLGTSGILPYDDSQVGQGEFQGTTVTATAYRSAMQARLISGDEEPLAYRAAGKDAAGVRTILAGATPDATAAQNFHLNAVARARIVAKSAAAAAAAADTFCRVAAPLATTAGSTYTPDELGDILTDLAGMTDEAGLGTMLRAYAAELRSGGDTSAWTSLAVRRSTATRVERACNIDVGDLLPNDTGDTE
ncbi:hypothetical protein ACIF8T_18075 [Streptomyces sp. NPDC085946]|uniref:hypothetical protein n=1 Tax=Streptomyces sp. NPDC085946 TaxID=3365744 RepID=UPI0037CED33B